MAKKQTSVIRYMSYRRHQIFYDKELHVYLVAIKRDGTDNYFLTYDEALEAIDKLEDRKEPG